MLPEEIRDICQDGSELSMVSQHRVIVSTCVSAGAMLTLGLGTKHFTHVYIDEVCLLINYFSLEYHMVIAAYRSGVGFVVINSSRL